MIVELSNTTNYANIYRVSDDSGKVVGTVEQRLAGRDCGVYCSTWSGRYTKRDIRKIWNSWWKERR